MLVVETVARIRREFYVKGKSIKEIVRDLRVSRNTVRKVLRSGETDFSYERTVQPLPKLGPWSADLERLLEANERKQRRERLTLVRVYEELQGLGYRGGYDAVRRYATAWQRERSAVTAAAYVPLSFAPGEAYQFDWSHEVVVIAGATTTVKVAHMRLCHSRMFFVRAYPRESQEMVFDAHDRAFAFFGGACQRGIYDNMKTAVDAIFVGRERRYNRRFQQMCGHYLVEPVACTPASGWEKGQVENQVGLVRERFFTPRLRFRSYDELNAWLLDRCTAHAQRAAHPELRDYTVWQVFEAADQPALIAYRGPFDGFHALPAAVSKTLLVRFDYNKYSVHAKAAGARSRCTPMPSASSSGRTAKSSASMPGASARPNGLRPLALCAGPRAQAGCAEERCALQDWPLPVALERVRRRLAGHADGDRQMVGILAAVTTDGLDAVEAACAEALAGGTVSRDVVLNVLTRQRQTAAPASIATPEALRLAREPVADCARYDSLRRPYGTSRHPGDDGNAEARRHAPCL